MVAKGAEPLEFDGHDALESISRSIMPVTAIWSWLQSIFDSIGRWEVRVVGGCGFDRNIKQFFSTDGVVGERNTTTVFWIRRANCAQQTERAAGARDSEFQVFWCSVKNGFSWIVPHKFCPHGRIASNFVVHPLSCSHHGRIRPTDGSGGGSTASTGR